MFNFWKRTSNKNLIEIPLDRKVHVVIRKQRTIGKLRNKLQLEVIDIIINEN